MARHFSKYQHHHSRSNTGSGVFSQIFHYTNQTITVFLFFSLKTLNVINPNISLYVYMKNKTLSNQQTEVYSKHVMKIVLFNLCSSDILANKTTI